MVSPCVNLAIDIGNTRTKLGLFEGRSLIEEHNYLSLDEAIIPNHDRSILSATGEYRASEALSNCIDVSSVRTYPISFDYKTFDTLGQDRIANACATVGLDGSAFLIIDCGTCVTYDLVVDNVFLGGAITPGMDMRFTAMNNLTANLPLTHLDGQAKFPGKSTTDSLRVGVLEGLIGEMRHFIDLSKDNNQELKVILTGGNYAQFGGALKKTTFADPNLTLRGLNEILLHLST
jgi:type III pantothenate kinase